MILYLVEKIKKLRKFLLMNGIFFVVLGCIIAISIQNLYPFIIAGVGFILWVPDLFFLASNNKKQFKGYSALLTGSWIKILCLGIFLIILPFIL